MSFYSREHFLIFIEENNIKTLADFRKRNPAMLLWYSRHKELIGELPLIKKKRANNELSLETCFKIAKKYQYRSDLQANDKGVYVKLVKLKKLDEACKHMVPKPRNYITEHVKNNILGKPAANRKNLEGLVFNSWYVFAPAKERKNQKELMWTCHCLECFDIYEVSGANLRTGASKKCVNCSIKEAALKRTGVIKTKRTPKESSEYYFFIKQRSRALRDGRKWGLTLEEVTSLIYGNCAYCGSKPSTHSNPLKNMGLAQKTMEGATIIRNGIDRIDSSKGYVQENVVTCCGRCNSMKLDYTVEEFKEHIRKLAKHLKLL